MVGLLYNTALHLNSNKIMLAVYIQLYISCDSQHVLKKFHPIL